MKKKIPLNTLYVSDLAQLYFPRSTVTSAVSQLRRWILLNPDLVQRLNELHYHKGQRALTPLQREAVIRYLGPPDLSENDRL
ncbi:MAG: DUF4248 domain-containing protein [Bacteroides sp.]|nr:DUF4248 domain-containing protein [Bacteroides sp.]